MIDDPVLVNDWHVVARATDVAESAVVSARLLDEDLVLWRRNGEAMAWRDLCPHRGTRLSLGQVDERGLVCPYHGWTYDQTGTCVRMPSRPDTKPPAKACTEVYLVRERYGLIWVSLGNPKQDIPPFREWNDPSFRHVLGGPYRIAAAGPRIIENFLDFTHLPFVHEGILGTRDRAEAADYEVEVGPDGITAREIYTWTPDPDGSGQAQMAEWLYRVLRPLTAYIELTPADSDSDRYVMLFSVTPVSESESIGWMWNSMDYNHEMSDEDFLAYVDEIVFQDIPIIESQRPELLPVDLQADVHVKADATSIAYRRWLKELGLSTGTL